MDDTKIKIMGVLNVTPDSFSDGGLYASFETACAQAEKMIAEGAAILDIGGESTRPFSDPVSTDEELKRVIPVIEAIRQKHDIPISIDTMKMEVAKKAIAAGATIINDVSALRGDPRMGELAADTRADVILMHMQGTPADMQVKPTYDNVVEEIIDFFKERIDYALGCGISRDRIIVDPGIGFGKNLAHNLSILKHLDRFATLGLPVMLAHSRKRFLGEITGVQAEIERDIATAVVAAVCAAKTIDYVRVHDVATTRQAIRLAEAIDCAR
ncbi:dihydropteroate synthase [Desulforhopalus singaporensis]|uniref:Dihydropteroate synthase n=1 Tax=Desulforhopalus singaporensis TaxID=91360 RepID=A0A1H0NES4_9BACT|nr:dihydropteroate synthase [Desulforhopalus singaporensis]SDO91118.1 Dihydropteroate synthase [Desulforhopalus singaporensis]